MRKSTTLMSSLAVAALAIAGSSAFTGGGLTKGAGVPNVFVGGTVTQNISGATLSSVVYTYTDSSNTSVASLVLTFAGAIEGSTPTIAFSGGTPAPYGCSAIATGASTCTPTGAAELNMTSLSITLATV
jgi:hypothetical protein